ncbi:MAG: hypothetical protein ABJL55_17680 [Roseibium sp.]
MMRKSLCILMFFASTSAFADNDPNRPTDKIATDLGIEEAVFIACFKPVNPEPGKFPTAAQQRANKALLLPCLQAANPAITNRKLDTVMDKYRPEGAFRKD